MIVNGYYIGREECAGIVGWQDSERDQPDPKQVAAVEKLIGPVPI